jgi:hypothetical protein
MVSPYCMYEVAKMLVFRANTSSRVLDLKKQLMVGQMQLTDSDRQDYIV